MYQPLRRSQRHPSRARQIGTGSRASAARQALLCVLLAATASIGTACAPSDAGQDTAVVVEDGAADAGAAGAEQAAQIDAGAGDSGAGEVEGAAGAGDAGGADNEQAGAVATGAETTASDSASDPATAPTQPIDAAAADNAAYNEAVRAEIEDTVATLFSGAIGEADPAWQDVIVRRMDTAELARLRQQPAPPPDAYRVAQGSVWVVGFRTDHAVTPANMLVDNDFELQDIALEDYPDDEGRTSIYYILSVTERGSRLQYTPLARGVLPATGAVWTLDELAAIESD